MYRNILQHAYIIYIAKINNTWMLHRYWFERIWPESGNLSSWKVRTIVPGFDSRYGYSRIDWDYIFDKNYNYGIVPYRYGTGLFHTPFLVHTISREEGAGKSEEIEADEIRRLIFYFILHLRLSSQFGNFWIPHHRTYIDINSKDDEHRKKE